jgi:hypothetical protein
VAGFAYLFLIVTGLVSAALWGGVRTAQPIADTLRSISEHSGAVRLSIVLTAVSGLTTLVLAAMLYAVVARTDRNLAILALSCRVVEAGLYAVGMLNTLALLALSQRASDTATGDLLMRLRPMGSNIGAIFFALGSTLYAYLLLRARSIPVALSATGVLGSLLVLVGVPIQTALGRSTFGGVSALIWVPVAVFEIATGVWLMVKGVRVAAAHRTEPEAVHR